MVGLRSSHTGGDRTVYLMFASLERFALVLTRLFYRHMQIPLRSALSPFAKGGLRRIAVSGDPYGRQRFGKRNTLEVSEAASVNNNRAALQSAGLARKCPHCSRTCNAWLVYACR